MTRALFSVALFDSARFGVYTEVYATILARFKMLSATVYSTVLARYKAIPQPRKLTFGGSLQVTFGGTPVTRFGIWTLWFETIKEYVKGLS